MQKVIIFDFDGTIADTFIVISTILKNLAREFGYKMPTDKEIALLRTQHPKDVMKTLGISYVKLPFLLHRAKAELQKEIITVQPIKGIENALFYLKEQNYMLGIVTSNNKENVQIFLEKNDLEIFDFIETGSSIFGKAKILNTLLKNNKLDKKDVIYVGDEIRDIEAAQKTGIKMIAVSWGFNDKEGLKKFYPDVLIDNPSELIPTLQKCVF